MVVSTWDTVFSSCHNNHELDQLPTRGVFESVRGTPIRNVPKRGKIVPKGGLLKLSRDGGAYPHAHITKGVLGHTPLSITLLVHPFYTREKWKKKLWMVGRSPGSTTNAADFDLESIWPRTWTPPSAKSYVPLFIKFLLEGVYPFMSNALDRIIHVLSHWNLSVCSLQK